MVRRLPESKATAFSVPRSICFRTQRSVKPSNSAASPVVSHRFRSTSYHSGRHGNCQRLPRYTTAVLDASLQPYPCELTVLAILAHRKSREPVTLQRLLRMNQPCDEPVEPSVE